MRLDFVIILEYHNPVVLYAVRPKKENGRRKPGDASGQIRKSEA